MSHSQEGGENTRAELLLKNVSPSEAFFVLIQVTVHYSQESGAVIPERIHTVVISVQHDDHVSLEEQRSVLMEKVIRAVIPAKYLDENTVYHLQPSGRFVIGGPQVTASPGFR